jgi:hypothetical protein
MLRLFYYILMSLLLTAPFILFVAAIGNDWRGAGWYFASYVITVPIAVWLEEENYKFKN